MKKTCSRLLSLSLIHIFYLASVTPIDDPGYECAPFSSREYESCGSRTADSAFLEAEEPQDTRPQNPGIPAFRTADSNVPEPQDPGASNTDFSQPDTCLLYTSHCVYGLHSG